MPATSVHARYLDDADHRAAIVRTLETRIDIPEIPNAASMGAVLASRVRAHAEGGPPLSEVISPDALERLFQHYRSGLSSELRGVMRTVHTALSEGCDSRADVLTPELIDDAIAAWEP